MNYFWGASSSQQQHQHHARLSLATKHWKSWERLQAAELQLIENARRMWTTNPTNPSQRTVPEVTVVDTPIPASSVSRNKSAVDERLSILSRWFCSSTSSDSHWEEMKKTEENPTDTLVMHSIQIENEQAPQKDVPLVLLHGYMNGGAYFYRNWMGLSQYFAKIHAVDLLGWGLSSRPDFLQLTATTHQNDDATTNINTLTIQSSEDFFVESLEAWRKAQNIDRMILAGHSMGGYISVAYCERYPERVQRLILISPAGVPEETPADLQRRERRYLHGSVRNRLLYAWYKHWVFTKSYTLGDLLRSLPESYGRNRFAEQYVTRRLPSITDPQEQQTLTDYLYHNNTLPGSGEYCLAKFLTPTICGRHPLVHRIPNLRIASCDFLYGETDWMDAAGGLAVEQACTERRQQQSMQPSTGANTASSITPHINVYQISRAGHLLMLENNVEFNHALVLAAGMESFLDANARRSLPQKLRPMTNHSLQSPPTNTPEHYPEAAAATTQVAA